MVSDSRRFYFLGSPLYLRPDLSMSSDYGTILWYTKFKDAETQGTKFEPITCKLDPRHRRGGNRIGDLKLVLPTSQPSDFVWTWMGPLVTEQVFTLFRDSSFSGFESLPTTIVKIKGQRYPTEVTYPKLWELRITGKGGDAHPDSGIRLLYSCPECGYTRYSSFKEGIIVDLSKWDGSDFFTVTGYPRFILVTERVGDLIIARKLSNCAIIRPEDLRWGDFPRPEDHPENFVPTKVAVKS